MNLIELEKHIYHASKSSNFKRRCIFGKTCSKRQPCDCGVSKINHRSKDFTRWLNQPIKNTISSSNWIISRQIRVKIQKYLKPPKPQRPGDLDGGSRHTPKGSLPNMGITILPLDSWLVFRWKPIKCEESLHFCCSTWDGQKDFFRNLHNKSQFYGFYAMFDLATFLPTFGTPTLVKSRSASKAVNLHSAFGVEVGDGVSEIEMEDVKTRFSVWFFPKIVGKPPKMDVENNGKPYLLMDDLGVPLFSETLYVYIL